MNGAEGRANVVGLKTVFCRVDGFGVNRRARAVWAKGGPSPDARWGAPVSPARLTLPGPCGTPVSCQQAIAGEGSYWTGLDSTSHLGVQLLRKVGR